MTPGGRKLSWVAGVVVMIASPAGAQEVEPGAAEVSRAVLVTAVQGSDSITSERRARVADAVGRALEARGYLTVAGKELLGSAVVACQTPECVERNLDAAGAELAIVPAIWAQHGGGEELTLTLLQRAARNLNVSGSVGEELSTAADALVDALLEKRAASTPPSAPVVDSELESGDAGPEARPKHPHAWKAGPIVLIAGGAAAFVAIGVGAAVKRDDQQLDTSAVAAWSAIGAAAIAGGVAWWVVGAKRRRPGAEAGAHRAPVLAIHPTRIDLRLRF